MHGAQESGGPPGHVVRPNWQTANGNAQQGRSCVAPLLSEPAIRAREKTMGKLGIKTDERERVGRGQQESGPL